MIKKTLKKIYKSQFKTLLILQLFIAGLIASIIYFFWSSVCDKSWHSCVGNQYSYLWFFFYSFIRPFIFTPQLMLNIIAGDAFGSIRGSIIASLGATLSTIILYRIAKYISILYLKPWFVFNLHSIYKFLEKNQSKIIFITRWVPILPFDIMSILYGILDFKPINVLLYTFIGTLPSSFVFTRLSYSQNTIDIIFKTLFTLILYTSISLIPFILYYLFHPIKRKNLIKELYILYKEIEFEIKSVNQIIRHNNYHKEKIPLVLLYGFFSSRRSVGILEKMLEAKGFDIISFNLGGLFSTFFTRSITDSANFIDKKIKTFIKKYQFKTIRIVAHSKGGLVGMWWLLKLGGYKYCDRIITMGTPFKGTKYTWLGLLTPLGYFLKDLWQMRPGSDFLQELSELPIPEHLRIYCLHSLSDAISPGKCGIFEPSNPKYQPLVIPVAINNVTHFEFLYKKEIGERLTALLKSD